MCKTVLVLKCTTAAASKQFSQCVICADSELLTGGLLRDDQLLASLGDNLVRLYLSAYSDTVEQANIDLDCLSSLHNLQHLHIDNNETNSVWHSQGLLSSLTALESFTFLGGAFHGDARNLHGPLASALGMLPKLTQLTMPWLPGDNIELCNTSFSALEGLHITSDAEENVPSDVSLSIGPRFDTLCDLSLIDCYVSSAPVLFATLPQLTRVEFERCSFAVHAWVSDALEGATQIEVLKLDNTVYFELPSSICQMRGLRQLSQQYSSLPDLAAEFAQLTNLTDLDLSQNDFTFVPEVLKRMTHLQSLDMTCCQSTQLTSPWTFFSAFVNLRFLSLQEAQPSWNTKSLFYIGETQAALSKAFGQRPPSEKPEVLLRDDGY